MSSRLAKHNKHILYDYLNHSCRKNEAWKTYANISKDQEKESEKNVICK